MFIEHSLWHCNINYPAESAFKWSQATESISLRLQIPDFETDVASVASTR